MILLGCRPMVNYQYLAANWEFACTSLFADGPVNELHISPPNDAVYCIATGYLLRSAQSRVRVQFPCRTFILRPGDLSGGWQIQGTEYFALNARRGVQSKLSTHRFVWATSAPEVGDCLATICDAACCGVCVCVVMMTMFLQLLVCCCGVAHAAVMVLLCCSSRERSFCPCGNTPTN